MLSSIRTLSGLLSILKIFFTDLGKGMFQHLLLNPTVKPFLNDVSHFWGIQPINPTNNFMETYREPFSQKLFSRDETVH